MIYNLLCFIVPVLLAILGFPVFGSKYGEHWEIIQLLSMFFMNVYFWLDMSMRLGAFARQEYVFYKSAGLSSGGIIKKYAKTNAGFLAFFAGLCFVCIYDGAMVENAIAWLQWVILTLAITIFVFEILHLRRRLIFAIGGICVAGVVFALLIIEMIQSGVTGMNRWSLHLLTEIGIMKVIKGAILEVNIMVFAMAICLLLVSVMLLALFDDRVIDGLKKTEFRARFLKKNRDSGINPGQSRAVLELKRLTRLKAYIFAVITEYVFVFLGIIFSLKFETDIVWWFYILAALGGLLAEAFYTLDIPCKLMYRLFGLSFRNFYQVKVQAVFLAEMPVVVLFILGFTFKCVTMIELLIVLVMLAIDVFYLNAFFSFKYLRLRYKNGFSYVVESFVAGVVAFIPVVNLIAGMVLYRQAEKRWREHVGD